MIPSLFLELDDTPLLIQIRCKYRLGAYENFECTVIFAGKYICSSIIIKKPLLLPYNSCKNKYILSVYRLYGDIKRKVCAHVIMIQFARFPGFPTIMFTICSMY